ncbi:MAG: SBBP repeat-containing protein [Chitinophagaceae bacterium]|jgi:hypothetical protein
MKKLISIVLVSFVAIASPAQQPVIDWMKSFGGSGADFAYALACDNSGNILVTGSFQGSADFDLL